MATDASERPGAAPRKVLPVLSIGLVAYGLLLQYLALHRYYDPDEFQHLQASWLIADGLVPYKDFFEHHTPLFYLGNALLLRLPMVRHVSPVEWILAFRTIGVATSLAVLYATYRLAMAVADRFTGWLAVLLLMSHSFFLAKAIEIRPDQMAVLALLGAALSLDTPRRWDRACLFLTGMLCAIGVMLTQKAVFALPGFFAHFAATRHGRRHSVVDASFVIVGGLVGGLPVLIYVLHDRIFGVFLMENVLGNALWPHNVYIAFDLIAQSVRDDTAFVVALVGSLVFTNLRWQTEPAIQRLGLIVRVLVSMLIGALLMPIAQEQYFILLLPFAAIAAAWFANRVLGCMPWRFARFAILALPIVTIMVHGARALALPDTDALRKIRYITTRTAPDATVMAGWSAGVAFRRPAFYYPFLHNEVRYTIDAAMFRRLTDDLRSGYIRPEVIDFDDDMQAVPGMSAVVEQLYAPTGVGTLWRRKP